MGGGGEGAGPAPGTLGPVLCLPESFRPQCTSVLLAPQVEMTPLENAIEVLENKNQQLKTLISQCQTRQMQNINPLTMCLNGVIDAAVNGGVSRYQEVRLC